MSRLSENAKKFIAWLVITSYLNSVMLFAAEPLPLTPDPSDVRTRPVIKKTEKGVDLIDITEANRQGISVNRYRDFNVNTPGLIFNNNAASRPVSSSSGEAIPQNLRLNGRAAKTILNEVTSVSKSRLLGDMEVAGSRANVIIANPNGISCRGCKFINTDRAVLTTGRPIIDRDSGELNGYRVTGGNIDILGDGLNAAETAQLDLIARSFSIDGPIYGKEINVFAGDNTVLYDSSGDVLQISAESDASYAGVGIDVSSLGGMYADKIYLVSNDYGIGVNYAGELAATDSLVIDSEGHLKNTGQISSEATAELTARKGGIENTGSISTQGRLSFAASEDVFLDGKIISLAGLAINANDFKGAGSIYAGQEGMDINAQSVDLLAQSIAYSLGDIRFDIAADIAISGALSTGGDATIETAAADITLSGWVEADQGLAIKANNLRIESTGVFKSGALFSATLSEGIENQGYLGGDTGITIFAETFENLASSSIEEDASGGLVISDGDILFNIKHLVSQQGSLIQSYEGDITLEQLVGDTTIQGQIATYGDDATVSLKTDGDLSIDEQGAVIAGNLLTLSASNIDNSGQLHSFGDLLIGQEGDLALAKFRNQGYLGGDTGITIFAETFENLASSSIEEDASGGLVISDGDILFNIKHLVSQQGSLIQSYEGDITLEQLVGDTTIQGQIATYGDDATVSLKTDGDLSIDEQGAVIAGNLLTLSASNIDNSGQLHSFGDLLIGQEGDLALAKFRNQGYLGGDTGITIFAETFENLASSSIEEDASGGLVISDGDILFNIKHLVSQQGSLIQSYEGDITLEQLVGDTTIQGQIATYGDDATVSLKTDGDLSIDEQGAVIAGNLLTLSASNIDNSGQLHSFGDLLIGQEGDLALAKFRNQGTIRSGGELAITADEIINEGISSLLLGETVTLRSKTSKMLRNEGTIYAGNYLSISSPGDLENTGSIVFFADDPAEESPAEESPAEESPAEDGSTEDESAEAIATAFVTQKRDAIAAFIKDTIEGLSSTQQPSEKATSGIDIELDGDFLQYGDVFSSSDLSIQANEIVNIKNPAAGDATEEDAPFSINVFGNTVLKTKKFTNTEAVLFGGELFFARLTDTAPMELTNSGDIVVGGNLIYRGDAFDNTDGTIKLYGEGNSYIAVGDNTLSLSGEIKSYSGHLSLAGGSIDNDADIFSYGALSLIADSKITNRNFLSADRLSLYASEVENEKDAGIVATASLLGDGSLAIVSSQLTNSGILFSSHFMGLFSKSSATDAVFENLAGAEMLSTGTIFIDNEASFGSEGGVASTVRFSNFGRASADALFFIRVNEFFNNVRDVGLSDWQERSSTDTTVNDSRNSRGEGIVTKTHITTHTKERRYSANQGATPLSEVTPPVLLSQGDMFIKLEEGSNIGGTISAADLLSISQLDGTTTSSFLNRALYRERETRKTQKIETITYSTPSCTSGGLTGQSSCPRARETDRDTQDMVLEPERREKIASLGGILQGKTVSIDIAALTNSDGVFEDEARELPDWDGDVQDELNREKEQREKEAQDRLDDEDEQREEEGERDTEQQDSEDENKALGDVESPATEDIEEDEEKAQAAADIPDAEAIEEEKPVVRKFPPPAYDWSWPDGRNALFIKETAPDSNYLYVSNPKYGRNSSYYLGSDYLLNNEFFSGKIDSEKILRLGDPIYEQRVFQEQLLSQTGKTSLGWVTDLQSLFASLMDKGAEVAVKLGLALGESPTAEQLDTLGEDFVWLEYVVVDGVRALAPKLYLSSATVEAVRGGEILGDDVYIKTDTFDNFGGAVTANNKLDVKTVHDIKNIGGTIAGHDVSLASEKGEIINRSIVLRGGDSDNYQDYAAQIASIKAGNDLDIAAHKDVDIIGATVSSGGRASIQSSTGDINVESLKLQKKSTFEYSKKGLFYSEYSKTVETEENALFAGISAGEGGLFLTAKEGNVNLRAAQIQSEGDATIDAQGIFSAALDLENTKTVEQRTTGITSDFIGHAEYSSDERSLQGVGSTFDVGGKLTLKSDDSIILEGGEISVGEADISGKEVEFVAARSEYEKTEESLSIGFVASANAGIAGKKAGAQYNSADKTKTWAAVEDNAGPPDQSDDGRLNKGRAISDELAETKVGIGIEQSKTDIKSTSYTNLQFNIKEGGNVKITATNKQEDGEDIGYVDLGGVDISGDETTSVEVEAGSVKTTKYVDEYEENIEESSTFVGVAASGTSVIADTVNSYSDAAQKGREGWEIDEGLTAAQVAGDATNLLSGDLAGGAVSATVRSSHSKTRTKTTSENTNTFNVGNIKIKSTSGDIDLNGVQIEANTELDSAGDINLRAAKSTSITETEEQNHNINLTATAGVSALGSGAGVEVGYNGDLREVKTEETTYQHSGITGGTVKIKSKNDVSLEGAAVVGNDVDLDIGGDLEVITVQDTKKEEEIRANWGGTVGASVNSNTLVAPTVSVDAGGGKAWDNSAKTTQQSGIVAKNRLTGEVGGDVELVGAHLVGKEGSLSVDGDIKAAEVKDYHDKDGNFGGGGGGFSKNGAPTVNINYEKVDRIEYEATQKSTINIGGNEEVTFKGELDGDINTDVTAMSEVHKDRKIAGTRISATSSPVSDIKEKRQERKQKREQKRGQGGFAGNSEKPEQRTTPDHQRGQQGPDGDVGPAVAKRSTAGAKTIGMPSIDAPKTIIGRAASPKPGKQPPLAPQPKVAPTKSPRPAVDTPRLSQGPPRPAAPTKPVAKEQLALAPQPKVAPTKSSPPTGTPKKTKAPDDTRAQPKEPAPTQARSIAAVPSKKGSRDIPSEPISERTRSAPKEQLALAPQPKVAPTKSSPPTGTPKKTKAPDDTPARSKVEFEQTRLAPADDTTSRLNPDDRFSPEAALRTDSDSERPSDLGLDARLALLQRDGNIRYTSPDDARDRERRATPNSKTEIDEFGLPVLPGADDADATHDPRQVEVTELQRGGASSKKAGAIVYQRGLDGHEKRQIRQWIDQVAPGPRTEIQQLYLPGSGRGDREPTEAHKRVSERAYQESEQEARELGFTFDERIAIGGYGKLGPIMNTYLRSKGSDFERRSPVAFSDLSNPDRRVDYRRVIESEAPGFNENGPGLVFLDSLLRFENSNDELTIDSASMSNAIVHLDAVIDRSEDRTKSTLYRSQDIRVDAFAKYKPGDLIRDPSFFSVSTSADIVRLQYSREGRSQTRGGAKKADEVDVYMIVPYVPGRKALNISKHKGLYRDTIEVNGAERLMPRNQLFRIIAKRTANADDPRNYLVLHPIPWEGTGGRGKKSAGKEIKNKVLDTYTGEPVRNTIVYGASSSFHYNLSLLAHPRPSTSEDTRPREFAQTQKMDPAAGDSTDSQAGTRPKRPVVKEAEVARLVEHFEGSNDKDKNHGSTKSERMPAKGYTVTELVDRFEGKSWSREESKRSKDDDRFQQQMEKTLSDLRKQKLCQGSRCLDVAQAGFLYMVSGKVDRHQYYEYGDNVRKDKHNDRRNMLLNMNNYLSKHRPDARLLVNGEMVRYVDTKDLGIQDKVGDGAVLRHFDGKKWRKVKKFDGENKPDVFYKYKSKGGSEYLWDSKKQQWLFTGKEDDQPLGLRAIKRLDNLKPNEPTVFGYADGGSDEWRSGHVALIWKDSDNQFKVMSNQNEIEQLSLDQVIWRLYREFHGDLIGEVHLVQLAGSQKDTSGESADYRQRRDAYLEDLATYYPLYKDYSHDNEVVLKSLRKSGKQEEADSLFKTITEKYAQLKQIEDRITAYEKSLEATPGPIARRDSVDDDGYEITDGHFDDRAHDFDEYEGDNNLHETTDPRKVEFEKTQRTPADDTIPGLNPDDRSVHKNDPTADSPTERPEDLDLDTRLSMLTRDGNIRYLSPDDARDEGVAKNAPSVKIDEYGLPVLDTDTPSEKEAESPPSPGVERDVLRAAGDDDTPADSGATGRSRNESERARSGTGVSTSSLYPAREQEVRSIARDVYTGIPRYYSASREAAVFMQKYQMSLLDKGIRNFLEDLQKKAKKKRIKITESTTIANVLDGLKLSEKKRKQLNDTLKLDGSGKAFDTVEAHMDTPGLLHYHGQYFVSGRVAATSRGVYRDRLSALKKSYKKTTSASPSENVMASMQHQASRESCFANCGHYIAVVSDYLHRHLLKKNIGGTFTSFVVIREGADGIQVNHEIPFLVTHGDGRGIIIDPWADVYQEDVLVNQGTIASIMGSHPGYREYFDAFGAGEGALFKVYQKGRRNIGGSLGGNGEKYVTDFDIETSVFRNKKNKKGRKNKEVSSVKKYAYRVLPPGLRELPSSESERKASPSSIVSPSVKRNEGTRHAAPLSDEDSNTRLSPYDPGPGPSTDSRFSVRPRTDSTVDVDQFGLPRVPGEDSEDTTDPRKVEFEKTQRTPADDTIPGLNPDDRSVHKNDPTADSPTERPEDLDLDTRLSMLTRDGNIRYLSPDDANDRDRTITPDSTTGIDEFGLPILPGADNADATDPRRFEVTELQRGGASSKSKKPDSESESKKPDSESTTIIYHPGLNDHERQQIQQWMSKIPLGPHTEIKRMYYANPLSKGELTARYKRVSKIAYEEGAIEAEELGFTFDERIAIGGYGRFGLGINSELRTRKRSDFQGKDPRLFSSLSDLERKIDYERFINDGADDFNRNGPEESFMKGLFLLEKKGPSGEKVGRWEALENTVPYLDAVIDRSKDRTQSTLYRVQDIKMDAFQKYKPGDLIRDPGFFSASASADAVRVQYAREGRSQTRGGG